MSEQFTRTESLIGSEGLARLQNAKVAVFGIGGVGGYVVEALARSGVGQFVLVDNDTVALSNLNRQIIATMDTLGRQKTEVMKERILSINPEADVEVHNCFYLPETAAEFDFRQYSYVVDAVDTVTAKIDIIMRATEAEVPVISSMGAGNKMDPTKFQVADIYKTSVCPLAKVMRRELKKRGIRKLKVVYSTEEALVPQFAEAVTPEAGKEHVPQRVSEPRGIEEPTPAQEGGRRKPTPGSIAFVPSVAGLILAGEVVKDLTGF